MGTKNRVFGFDAPRGIVTGISAKEVENVTRAITGKMSSIQDLEDFNATYVNFFSF